MQLFLSPAKLMNFDKKEETIEGAKPLFSEKTELLIEFCQQLNVGEIAKLLKISQTAVTTRLSRGRKALEEKLKEV